MSSMPPRAIFRPTRQPAMPPSARTQATLTMRSAATTSRSSPAGVSDEERAAVIAVLTEARAEESRQVKRVARRDREPWARSQRVPDGFADLLIDG